MPRRREERGLRSGGTVTRSAHVMSSRIRGRRYRNEAPDDRYGFSTPPSIVALGPAGEHDPILEVVSLDGTPLDGTTVMMDGTSVTMGSGASLVEPPTVLLEPRTVTGPPQTEG